VRRRYQRHRVTASLCRDHHHLRHRSENEGEEDDSEDKVDDPEPPPVEIPGLMAWADWKVASELSGQVVKVAAARLTPASAR
jgi:hypothetical protein